MGIYKIRTEFGHQLKWLMGILAFIFVVGAIWSFGTGQFGDPQGSAGDETVVATVNHLEISRGELNAALDTMQGALRDAGVRSTLQVAEARARLIQQLVNARFTLLLADKLGVPVDENAVEAKREEILVQRLRVHRSRVMGKISSEEERLDPREDGAYRSALRNANLSLDEVVKQQSAYLPNAEIQQALAQDAIRRALERKAGMVSLDDIKNSYNVYSMRQIVIPTSNLPEAQLKTRVDKIVAEAKKGADFGALGKQYSADPAKGKLQTVSYGMLPPDVWDRLSTMKTGEVGSPIATDLAVYVVKVENVAQKLPAKFDKKAQDERRKMITSQRMFAASLSVQQQMGNPKVVVKDPEMRGYWLLSQAGQTRNPAEAKQNLALAQKALKEAYGKSDNVSQYPGVMLALVMKDRGDKAGAKKLLGQLLEGQNSPVVGADLHIIYADLLLDSGSKEDAIKQYQVASESAGPLDGESHKQLIAKFKKLGRMDLAAQEQEAYDKYLANKKLIEAQQAKNAPQVPQPTTPTGP